jgi:hypothetical protein
LTLLDRGAWTLQQLKVCDVSADMPAAADAILRYVYYWYNFMPLARGSAAVGYTTILSLFWALGMPVSVNIPKDYQPDWEAILCQACALLRLSQSHKTSNIYVFTYFVCVFRVVTLAMFRGVGHMIDA